MRSGWPHTYSDSGYQQGDYRYGAGQRAALPAAGQGEHPYAAFSGAGYGDDGYTDPGYQGPAAQDAGIAGTRTVRGFVEQPRPGGGYQAQPGYGQPQHALPAAPPSGYVQNGYPAAGHPSAAYPIQGHGQQSYAGSSYAPGGDIELAYPAGPQGGERPGAAWDYDQPLRYDDEEPPYYPGEYPAADGYGQPGQPAAYNPADYNGSEYSRPGIDGPGYDLSGIIGTTDFDAVGYDEPSYGRLSYDDPRYDPPSGGPRGGDRFDQTRFDMPALPAFDDTRLDQLWLSGEDARGEGPGGYGNDGFGNDGFGDGGFGGDTRPRSMSADYDRGSSGRFDETRLDLNFGGQLAAMDHTRFDMPAFDETRLDNLRALGPDSDLRPAGGAVLAPPAPDPMDWAEQTSFDSFDSFDGLDLAEEPAPAAFTRTLDRPEEDDTAARRAVGRRRGRSGDRRQWMALGAIAVVAAGAIGGVLMKFKFAGPSGPAHTITAPTQLDGYARNAGLEKTMKVGALAESVAKSSGGQATSLAGAVYTQGGAIGGNEQVFMFVGGKLASADPGASVTNFEQTYPGAAQVPTGAWGGNAACAEAHITGQKGQVAMCVWFDNDTFGALVSSTMSPAKLATTMDTVRPTLEHQVK